MFKSFKRCGRLGNGKTNNFKEPQKISNLKNIIKVACGDAHTLALSEDGVVYAWGQNAYGQLGNGIDYDDYLEPVKLQFPEKIVYVSCGSLSSAAISESGVLYTWGWGGRISSFLPIGIGTHGRKSTKNSNKPEVVELEGVTQISLGKRHAGCITKDNNCFFWGRGDWGRLGTGSNASTYYPRQLFLPFTVKKVSLANNFSGMLSTDGDLYTFGKNDRNQLGFESPGNIVSGNQFDGITVPTLLEVYENSNRVKFSDLGLGESICAASAQDGSAYMWGGTLLEPAKVITSDKEIVSVSGGSNHLAFLSKNGDLYTAGSNWHGQLGVSGKFFQNQDIVKVPIDKKVVAVACGSDFTVLVVEETEETETTEKTETTETTETTEKTETTETTKNSSQ